MTSREDELNDDALDAMLETIARREAPRNLAVRVATALDARATSRAGLGLGLSMAAVAGLALLVGAIWIVARHPATPPSPVVTSRNAPAPAPASNAATPTPRATVQDTGPVAVASRAARVTHSRASRADDHDRALPALDALPVVQQSDITPRSLGTTSLEIDPMNAIAPLTVQSGRDAGGRGDF